MIKSRVCLFMLVLLYVSGYAQKKNSISIASKSITTAWDLNKSKKQGTFKILPYKPIYITASRWSDSPNRLPYSENEEYTVTEFRDYNSFEVKFQLSFKTKLAESILFGEGDLWVGYTQKAHWQIYNTDISRPFRELNYEPELILTYPLNLSIAGFNIKMASVALNHQSNGRDFPRSRSWNRVIFNIAMQRKNLTFYLSPWIRLPDSEDENPLITSYIGNGRLTAIYRLKKHMFYAIATNSFTLNDNRGSLQLNYLYPINDNLNLHAQMFSGYGETLIDYNHYQNTIGIGVSFSNW